MMMPYTPQSTENSQVVLAVTPQQWQENTGTVISKQRLQKLAKQLNTPSFNEMQPISTASNIVVLGAPYAEVAGHQHKFQQTNLINQLQQQVDQVAGQLEQLQQTQQVEQEVLRLFNKIGKAFKGNNTELFQRHWNSWCQLVDVLPQQTQTLYSATTEPTAYNLPDWLFENTPPEALESLAQYEAFWQQQQQLTAQTVQQVQQYGVQLQIKLENWLAAQTAPTSN